MAQSIRIEEGPRTAWLVNGVELAFAARCGDRGLTVQLPADQWLGLVSRRRGQIGLALHDLGQIASAATRDHAVDEGDVLEVQVGAPLGAFAASDPEEEAVVERKHGAGVAEDEILFRGRFEDATDFVWRQDRVTRGYLAIFTKTRQHTPWELELMRQERIEQGLLADVPA